MDLRLNQWAAYVRLSALLSVAYYRNKAKAWQAVGHKIDTASCMFLADSVELAITEGKL